MNRTKPPLPFAWKVAIVVLGLALVAYAALFPAPAAAQAAGTITFTAETTTGDGQVTPVLTWSTQPAADNCVASGDWSGNKGATGSEVLAPITTSRTYNLTCSWSDTRATLTWTAPTTNTDGTPLTDLLRFVVYYGTAPGDLSQIWTVNSPSATQTEIEGLAPATWFFAMTAVNQRLVESARTNIVSKTTGSASAQESVGITVNPRPNPPTNVTAT